MNVSVKVRIPSGYFWVAFILFVLFLGLKLGHVINWSWWLVTSPLLVYVGLAALLVFIAVFILLPITYKRAKKAQRSPFFHLYGR